MYYNPANGRYTPVRQLVIAITLVLAVTFSALAQTMAAPDFSGTWVLSAAKSTLAKDSTIKSQTIAIAHKKSTIVFDYKTDGKKSKETYTVDGKERGTNMPPASVISKASWRNSVLVPMG